MSWPGFHAPSAAWLFALVVPLVLLYFLKLRRPTMKVPSLALWRVVLQDQRVNSPFQRFRRNLLLWLQLAILCLIVLAAMLPFFRGVGSSNRTVILIDRSASMGARDKLGGETRLALAKERARTLIDGLSPNQEVALIAFGRTARQLVPFTNAHRVLLRALDDLAVEEVEGDVVDALRMADAMARSAPFDRVVLLSDGNIPGRIDFDLPFELDYEKLPPAGANLGITGLRARRDGARGWSVFVRVQGTEGVDIPCELEVRRGDTTLFTEPVHISDQSGQRFVFPIAVEGSALLEFRLRHRGFDSMPADDRAYLALEPGRPLRVLVDRELSFFRHGLAVLPDLELDTAPRASTTYDLVLTAPGAETPLALTTLHAGGIPPDLTTLLTVETLQTGTETVVDWQRSSPLLEHVELSELLFGQRVRFAAGVRLQELESLRYEILAQGSSGPLIVAKEDGGLLHYHLLFDPLRSTLPYRVGFPILCRNLVDQALQRAGLLDKQAPRTGVLAPLPVPPNTEFTVVGPGGATTTVRSDSGGLLTGIATPQVGPLLVRGGGTELQVGASLLSLAETALRTTDQLQMNELSQKAVTRQVTTDRSLWMVLAALALGVLLVEWWVFQAKPGGHVRVA
ncbi:MAG: VWA domain-containing protein [Planctomycetes bacterium]|nr:VWA domain-containing protein [Planctomycetota bacterium]